MHGYVFNPSHTAFAFQNLPKRLQKPQQYPDEVRDEVLRVTGTFPQSLVPHELLPDGIHVMSQEMKGLILLSSNVGVLELLPDGRIHVLDCIRAVEDTLRDEISQRYETLASLCGFEAERGTGFGSWAYDAGSKLRALCSGVYKDMFGKDMVYTFSHGGLECGELRSKIPDLDIVCMCPTAREAHTTEEALDLASFKRMYDCLVEVMKKLCEA